MNQTTNAPDRLPAAAKKRFGVGRMPLFLILLTSPLLLFAAEKTVTSDATADAPQCNSEARKVEALQRARRERFFRKAEMLTDFDTNRNGRLDRDELHRLAQARMQKWDANRNGRLDPHELKRMHRTIRKRNRDAQEARRQAGRRSQPNVGIGQPPASGSHKGDQK